jgi:nucleotide-binding universal stress UspA family protein
MVDVTTAARIEGGIVVGHDGSRASTHALEWAARLAARIGEPLHVVRAWSMSNAARPASFTGGYVPSLVEFEEAVRDALEADVARADIPDGVPVTCHACHGAAGQRLVESSVHADLLVLASRGAGGFRGLRFGSTADQVVRHAPCPVVVVPVESGDGRALDDHSS